MEQYQGEIIIIGVCGIIILILTVKANSPFIFKLILRSLVGSILILGGNQLLHLYGFAGNIGLNPVTVLTTGILGFPGVILLFSIIIYSSL